MSSHSPRLFWRLTRKRPRSLARSSSGPSPPSPLPGRFQPLSGGTWGFTQLWMSNPFEKTDAGFHSFSLKTGDDDDDNDGCH